MAQYSKAEKNLHRFYLSNYFISKASLELEDILFGKKAAAIGIKEYIFVTGLARSGTTALMNKIFSTGEYASLQYSNMPILLSPNLWKKEVKIDSHQRAHEDGIIIDGNSPEEFDEYFWKAFLKDSYIKENGLIPHEIDSAILDKYLSYIQLICFSKGKQKYISKNNNNILRLSALDTIKGACIIVLFREPLAHASSLLKLHKKFSQTQEEDPFELEYFNFLGHHEFGKGHKPFLLTEKFKQQRQHFPKDQLNYWLSIWINYYEYLLSQPYGFELVSFEDLILDERRVLAHLAKQLTIPVIPASVSDFKPPAYPAKDCDPSLMSEANALYEQLKLRTSY
jgi:hypothetical protein